MAHAKLEIISGFIRVYGEGQQDPDPFEYACNFRSWPGKRKICELFGVMSAPTREQLKAIHKLLRCYGFEEYVRTTGVGKQRRWLVKGN